MRTSHEPRLPAASTPFAEPTPIPDETMTTNINLTTRPPSLYEAVNSSALRAVAWARRGGRGAVGAAIDGAGRRAGATARDSGG
jgi:hypothetical protein